MVINFIGHLLQFLRRGILLGKLKSLRTEKWICKLHFALLAGDMMRADVSMCFLKKTHPKQTTHQILQSAYQLFLCEVGPSFSLLQNLLSKRKGCIEGEQKMHPELLRAIRLKLLKNVVLQMS